MSTRWFVLFLLCLIALVAVAAFLVPMEMACDDLYQQRATKFEVEGVFGGHGEGHIDPAMEDRCWDTSFGVDGKLYYATGRWKGDLPNIGDRIHIVSPTGLVKDVIITDVETGKKYISGYRLSTPQP